MERALLLDSTAMPSPEILKQVIHRLTDEHLELLVGGLRAKRDRGAPTERQREAQRGLDLLIRRQLNVRLTRRSPSSRGTDDPRLLAV